MLFTAGCIWLQLSKRQAIFRSQDVTLHLSDFRDKCECMSPRWHPLIRNYVADKRVVLVRTVWHKQRYSKAVTSDQAEGRNCGKSKSRFSPVKYDFSQTLPVPSVAFDLHGICILDICGKIKNPLQRLKCRIILSCLWFSRCSSESPNNWVNHEQILEPGSVCGCVFSTLQKWEVVGTERGIIWEDRAQ